MKCRFCGSTENLSKDGRNRKVQRYSCRSCRGERTKKYRKTESGRAAASRAARKYDERNPHKRKIWTQCRVLASKPCQVCGVEKTDKHHPDYAKPLEVMWLCRLHHKQIHPGRSIINPSEANPTTWNTQPSS